MVIRNFPHCNIRTINSVAELEELDVGAIAKAIYGSIRSRVLSDAP
jgi:hypothetical protein